MVAADAEERLYDGVTAAGVTPLTMSQRLFLPKLHKQELRLGVDSASRWSLATAQAWIVLGVGQLHSCSTHSPICNCP